MLQRGRNPKGKKKRITVLKKVTPRKPERRSAREETEERPEAIEAVPASPAKKESVVKGIEEIWAALFASPVHLDSLLSKQTKSLKSILAQVVPPILLRPGSIAEAVGVGVPPGEPWSLSPKELARWRPAILMGGRLYEMMTAGASLPEPIADDFPPRMIEEWRTTWGEETARELIRALGEDPPLSLRASKALGASALLQELRDAKVPVRAQLSEIAPFGVRLSGYASVLSSGAYERGELEIQDEASQLMALFALWPGNFGSVLQTAPGKAAGASQAELLGKLPSETKAWTVIDACAGAGGKTLALADALGGKGRVFAYDTSPKKLQALRRRASRAGLRNIQTVEVANGREAEVVSRFRRRADVVLVDAPCTGWGVLRRNPDIKWRQEPEALERMPQVQIRLLSAYSDLVAQGGRLVFGVCTFRKAETVEIVSRFLEAHPDFEPLEGGYLGPGPCDGFFMQAFQRKK